MTMLDEIRFWAQVLGDSRRTILCSPENGSRIKTWLDARGYGLYTVRATPAVPDDRVYVLDEHAIAAASRQAIGRWFP